MGKEVWQGCIWSPRLFNFDVEATVHGPTELDMTERLSTAQSESESCSGVSNSLRPHGLYSPWNSPGQNTGVGSLSLIQGIFQTQRSNPGLPHCRQILHQLSHKGSPDGVGHSEKGELQTAWHEAAWTSTLKPQFLFSFPNFYKELTRRKAKTLISLLFVTFALISGSHTNPN